MRALKVVTIFISPILLGYAFPIINSGDGDEDRSKIIIFSHKYHIEEVGADCSDCHLNVHGSSSSDTNLLPKMEQCYSCHVEEDTECSVCHVSEDYVEFENPKRDYKFNHSAHGTEREDVCSTCHKGIEKVDLATFKQIPEMEYCMGCHNDTEASGDCSVCHFETEIAQLRPSSHLPDWTLSHSEEARFSENECAACHTESFCQDCHDVDELITVTGERMDFFSPNVASVDEEKGQALQKVHGLDYRYTHSFDAKGKTFDCAVCHEMNDFCATCHNPEDDMHRLEPEWHGGLDWGAIAGNIGSGGGRHGEMARRDMELCASCHDVEGVDPICLSCHVDANFGLGNDPATHEQGFMSGTHGEWHFDQDYLCYNCHTGSPFKAGVGFCGYCHGEK